MEERMKKGQELEGKVIEVQFPNKGIVEIEDEEKRVIVKNSLAGQRVKFRINKIRKGKCEGRLLEVLEKAPEEIVPVCPHFADCGGCTYQHLPYAEQIKMKQKQVKGMLDEVVCSEYFFEGILESPQVLEYRNKMEFSFGDEIKDGPLALGMHKRGSFYDIVNVPQCCLVDTDFGKILNCVLEYCKEQGFTFYHKLSHQGYLRHLLVRKGVKTGEILIDIVTTTQVQHSFVDMVERLCELELKGKLAGILHTDNDSLADIVQSDNTKILYGQDYFYEELLGLKFKISPFSFFQTNSLGAEVLYEKVRSYVGETKDKVLFDLYSGTGTIAQMLALVAKRVIGIEIVEEAVQAANVNAKKNGLNNCEFIAGDVLKAIDLVEEIPDLIVLDPPRDGIHPKALKKIIDFGVERIVYISCKPTSLVRDLVVLQEQGYWVEKVACVDMFPGTPHVETVVLLSKLKGAQSIEVKINLDEMDLTQAESKATYDEIKAYVLEQTDLKVSQLYIAQVKRKHGIIERENYNTGEGKAKAPQVPMEKEQAIEDALRYFKMI